MTARITPGLAGAPTEVDVVVIGLGITGAGVALDAVTRGLSVLAVDAHDLAFGTSRWSSKLVHGGLRYLAAGQVGVAHESAVERGILMEVTAPHLTHAMPTLIPLNDAVAKRQAAVIRGGTARRRPAAPRRPHQHGHPAPAAPDLGDRGAPAGAAAAHAPGCAARCSAGTASSRTTPGWSTTVARTAASYGAHVRTRARVLSATGTSVRAARRAHRRDATTSPPARSSTRPASGPATWSTRSRCAPAAAPTWCCARSRMPGLRVAVFAPVPGDDQPVRAGAAPARRHRLRRPHRRAGRRADPRRARADRARDRLPARRGRRRRSTQPLHRSDVVGRVRRPAAAARPPATPARPPTCPASTPCSPAATGVVTIVGGKLTTYRRMAEDAVDAALAARRARRRRRAGPARCRCSARPTGSRWPGSSSRPGWSAATAPTPGWCSTTARDRHRAERRRAARARSPTASRSRWPSWSSGSPTRAPPTSTTCSTGVPASAWSRPTAPSPYPPPSGRWRWSPPACN